MEHLSEALLPPSGDSETCSSPRVDRGHLSIEKAPEFNSQHRHPSWACQRHRKEIRLGWSREVSKSKTTSALNLLSNPLFPLPLGPLPEVPHTPHT